MQKLKQTVNENKLATALITLITTLAVIAPVATNQLSPNNSDDHERRIKHLETLLQAHAPGITVDQPHHSPR